MSRSIKILDFDWPRTQKYSPSIYRQGGQLLLTFLTMVTFHVQFLCSNWSKFDSWVQHLETCGDFNCLFTLDEQNEIQLLKRFFCYSWLVCFLGFWLRNAPLVSYPSDSFFKNGLTHLTLKVSSDSGLTWWLSGAVSRLVNLSNYFIWCFFFLVAWRQA